MKRLIFIAILLQFVFTPFCGVLAMNQKEVMLDEDCISMQASHSSLELRMAAPHLSCCESRNLSSTDAQLTAAFEHHIPVICLQSVSYNQSIPLIHDHDRQYSGLHPPDDFERISQSKRE